jgi:NADH-quinone oxidoreductase subunit F
MQPITTPHDLASRQKKSLAQRKKVTHIVSICNGTGCQASRSGPVVEALNEQLSKQGLEKKVKVRVTGCQGFCEQGPIIIVEPGGILYCRVTPDDAADIVSLTLSRFILEL